jgi:hypothetical protein
MWKQSYYPPFEESGYDMPSNTWRYGFAMFVVMAIASFTFAYYLIDANNGFNHGFTEPAKELKTTTHLTNTLIPNSTTPNMQGIFEIKGLDVTKEAVKNLVVKHHIQPTKATPAAPITKKEPEQKPIPVPDEPVTAPRISQ